MRIAIISDIHGNIEALKTVYNDITASNIDLIICLGDLIGYGPEPEKVVEFIIDKEIKCTLGNHDLLIFDNQKLNYNEDVLKSIDLSKKILSKKSVDFIKNLPKNIIKQELLFVHAFPPDNIFDYVFSKSDQELIGIFKKIAQNICFVGHTHELGIYSFDNEKIIKRELDKGIQKIDKIQKHIINVGSVGQPRDGNNNAKYAIFDKSNFTLEIKFIPYDIKVTVDLINEKGFPEYNASRLW